MAKGFLEMLSKATATLFSICLLMLLAKAPVAAISIASPTRQAPGRDTVITATPQTLLQVVNNAVAGQVIRLAPGDYAPIQLRMRDWTPAITIEAGNAHISSIELRDVAGLTWHGGIFDGKETIRSGFNAFRSQRIIVENGRFSHYLRNGIGFSEGSDARLIGNNFSDMGSDGIDIALSRRVLIDGTKCHDFRPTPGAHPDCIQLWSRPSAPPTADITVINTVAAGEMQGVTAFNHVRDNVDDGGFDRIIFASNDIRISFAQAVSLYDCRDCVARDNYIDTWENPHNRARLVVMGRSSVEQCGNVIKLFPKLPGQNKCKNLLPPPTR